jgi:hypothetical protein
MFSELTVPSGSLTRPRA